MVSSKAQLLVFTVRPCESPLLSVGAVSALPTIRPEEELQNPTLDKYRRQMFLVYKHGQRHGLIPRTQEANPLNFVRQSSTSDDEAITITPLQVIGFQELAMVAGDGIEPPTGTENTQVIDSTKTQKTQNTTKKPVWRYRGT
jgi:hypothetical protein